MRDMRREWVNPVAIGAVLLMLTGFSAYAGGYFLLGKRHDFEIEGDPIGSVRCFHGDLLETIYAPAAKVESFVTGRDIVVPD